MLMADERDLQPQWENMVKENVGGNSGCRLNWGISNSRSMWSLVLALNFKAQEKG